MNLQKFKIFPKSLALLSDFPLSNFPLSDFSDTVDSRSGVDYKSELRPEKYANECWRY